MNKTTIGLLATLTLLAAGPATALERAALDTQMERYAREARRDLRIENLAALERAPAQFLTARPGPRDAGTRWVQVELVSSTPARHEAPR